MSFPLITVGQVIAQDPDGGGVTIVLKATGQAPGYQIRMGYPGAADALRIKQHPLPGRGTWGIIAFPYGNPLNGVWLCSYFPNGTDAITTTTSGSGSAGPNDGFIEYHAHFSGFMSLLDGNGNFAEQFPDGSYILAGSGTNLPTVYRHTVGTDNARSKVAFNLADRVPNQPSPFNLSITHVTGSSASIDVSGNVVVSGVGNVSISAAQNVMLSVSGNATISVAGSATISAQGQLALTGQPITLN